MYFDLMRIAAMVLRNEVITKNQMIPSDNFSGNELSTSKKMAQNMVCCVHMAPEEVFKQVVYMINRKIPIQQT